MIMNNIFNYKLSDLEDYFVALGEKKFKARQIYDWLYKKQVYDFKDMTNIKKDLILKKCLGILKVVDLT